MLYIAGKIEADIEKNFEIIQKLSKRLIKLKVYHETLPLLIENTEKNVLNMLSRKRNEMDEIFEIDILESRKNCFKLDGSKINKIDSKHDFKILGTN